MALIIIIKKQFIRNIIIRSTIYQFKLLSDKEGYYLVGNKVQFLTYRLKLNSRSALYALNKIFVEIKYDVKSNQIVNKVSFISGERLDFYSNIPDVND